jgi:hypothetical protein
LSEQDIVGLEISTALLEQYRNEGKEFLGYLAELLTRTMPNAVSIQRQGLFKKTLQGISVTFREGNLALRLSPTLELEATFTRVVRGIALKTDELNLEEWIALLSDEIEKSVRMGETSRNSLAKLLGLP